MMTRISFLWLTLFTTALFSAACDRDKSSIVIGTALQIEVDGLRNMLERHAVSDGEHVLLMGSSGSNLNGQLILLDGEGNTLLDMGLEQIQNPNRLAACVRGTEAVALFLTEEEGIVRVHEAVIREGRYQPGESNASWIGSERSGLQIGEIVGHSDDCGLCVFASQSGELVCRFSIGEPQATVWQIGSLGRWTVVRVGQRLALLDWSADEEGWILVRIGILSPGGEEPFSWKYGYRIGQLLALAGDNPELDSQPRFIPTSDGVSAIFIDGTQWFSRIFYQSFPLDSDSPDEAVPLQACRGTCAVLWVGLIDAAAWVWYRDQEGDWAERIISAEERERRRFIPPPGTLSLGDDLFKMGLGNEIANFWRLLEFQ